MQKLKFSRVVIFIFLCLIPSLGFAQLYKNEIEKVNILRNEGDLKTALSILKNLEANAQKNHPEELAKIYSVFTKYYFSAEDFKQAENYSKKALQFGEKSKNPIALAYGNYSRAYYFYQLNLPEIAMNFAKKAEKLSGENSQYYDLKSALSYLFYSIHSQWNDSKLSDFYAQKTIENGKKAQNQDYLMNAYSAKATAMGFKFQETKNTVYQDSVKYFLHKSISVFKKFPAKVPQRTYALTNLNLANQFYLELKNGGSKSLTDSIKLYLTNIDQLQKFNDYNYEIRANALGIQSEMAMQNGDKKSAENYLLNAFNLLLREEKRPAYYTLYNVATALEEFYKSQGNFGKALEFSDKKLEFSRKDFDETAQRNVRTLEAKYETEKIKTELELSEQKNKQKQIHNYLFLAIALLAGSTLYFTSRNFKNKIKLQNEQAENLEIEKKQAETQLQLENETKARLLAEQKILKLEHEKVQKEAMVNALKVERKNELLNEITSKISNQEMSPELRTVLKKEERIEGSLDHSVKDFAEINPIFFEQLKEKSAGKLTQLDLRYCAYIFMGLSSKEIATLSSVEPKTVRMAKYRIKQKLNLDKETDLGEFLRAI